MIFRRPNNRPDIRFKKANIQADICLIYLFFFISGNIAGFQGHDVQIPYFWPYICWILELYVSRKVDASSDHGNG